MSNYAPKFIDAETWQIINATIRKYPRMYARLAEIEESALHGQAAPEEPVAGGRVSDQTAARGIKLAGEHRRELIRKCEAVNWCLAQLNPDHLRVVSLRFWGVDSPSEAIELAQGDEAMRGLKYESVRGLATVSGSAGYSVRGAKNIVHAFVVAVGRELGEI